MRIKKRFALLITAAMIAASMNIMPLTGFAAGSSTGTDTTPAEGSTSLTMTIGHTWNYSAGTGDKANVITATCSRIGCAYHTNGAALTLSASSSVYTESAVVYCKDGTNTSAAIQLTGLSGWTTAGAAEPGDIVYYESEGSGSTTEKGSALGSAPSAVGNYVAEITVSDGTAGTTNKATAKAAFSINNAGQDAPAAGTGYIIDYAAETLTADPADTYEVSSTNGDTATALSNNKLTPDASAVTYYVRKKAKTSYNASSWTAITIPARPAAPAVTVNYSDVTADTTALMEYKLESGSWTDCTADMSVSGWMGKTVQIRVKATDSQFASFVQTISVHAHTWAYSVEGNQLKACCSDPACPLGTQAQNEKSLTVSVPAETYPGKAYGDPADAEPSVIQIAGLSAWNNAKYPALRIAYSTDGGSVWKTVSPDDTLSAGDYQVRISPESEGDSPGHLLCASFRILAENAGYVQEPTASIGWIYDGTTRDLITAPASGS